MENNFQVDIFHLGNWDSYLVYSFESGNQVNFKILAGPDYLFTLVPLEDPFVSFSVSALDNEFGVRPDWPLLEKISHAIQQYYM